MTFTNNPTIDKIIIWHGFGYPHRKSESWDSSCRLRIWQQQPIIVLFSDLNEDNTGTSLTNCSENLATLVQFHFQLLEPIRWFEHYPYHNISQEKKKQLIFKESLSEVFYDHNGKHYHSPRWKHFEREPFETLVHYLISMNGYRNLKKVRLKTAWEHEQDEFYRGCSDAVNDGTTRDYPPHSQAYLNGFRYAIHQLSQRN